MKKSLVTSNPYLQDPVLKKKMLKNFIQSSSAIEGIHVDYETEPTTDRKKSSKHKNTKACFASPNLEK
jgi:hypothetical protein